MSAVAIFVATMLSYAALDWVALRWSRYVAVLLGAALICALLYFTMSLD